MADSDAVPFSAYDGILSLLGGPDGPIIACGQAVNFWADRYQAEEPRLEALRPFMSKDLDILGDLAAAERIARATESEIQRAPPRGATPVLANIHLKAGGTNRLVQVLYQIPGLNTDDVRKEAIGVDVFGYSIRVADPITLLAGKIYNVAHFDQKNRNDIQHVKILCLCVPVFLSKRVEAAERLPKAARTCLDGLERVLALSASPDAAKVGVELGINWLDLIPLAALRASPNAKLQSFAEKRLKHWRAG